MDEWCCHPNPFADKKLLPRAEDCLVTDTHLLLHRDTSCDQTLTEEVSVVPSKDGQDSKVKDFKKEIIKCTTLHTSLLLYTESIQTLFKVSYVFNVSLRFILKT